MTDYPGETYVYLSVDAAADVSADPLLVGLALDDLPATAEPVPDPGPDLLAATPRPKAGHTRYWWRVLAGAGQDVPLSIGANTLYGLRGTEPAVQPHCWRFSLDL